MRPPPGWTPAQWVRISAAHAARTAPDGGGVCAAAGRPPEAKVISAPSMIAGRNLRSVIPACPETSVGCRDAGLERGRSSFIGSSFCATRFRLTGYMRRWMHSAECSLTAGFCGGISEEHQSVTKCVTTISQPLRIRGGTAGPCRASHVSGGVWSVADIGRQRDDEAIASAPSPAGAATPAEAPPVPCECRWGRRYWTGWPWYR